jgi:hypothetical protein
VTAWTYDDCFCTEAAIVLGCPIHDADARPARLPVYSPDCRDGNHQKCDGAAWDLNTDALAPCGCVCHAYDESEAERVECPDCWT